ncbi:UNVERIFIED_CONTAM: hypothetical protein GTU68_013078 [Idotea baltica]|nr:hypothetical protein [Idotea baltica]
MDFVVSVLENIFNKTPAEAVKIMLKVHKDGQGLTGFYPREIAETKCELVARKAKEKGFPLKAIMEKE